MTPYYLGAAFALGAIWFAVLLPFGGAMLLPRAALLIPNLLAMCFASVTLAIIFRPLIRQSRGFRFHLLALVLPSVGAVIFGFYAIIAWSLYVTPPYRTPQWDEALYIPALCVIYGAWGLFFITIPMGYLSQWIMQRTSFDVEKNSLG